MIRSADTDGNGEPRGLVGQQVRIEGGFGEMIDGRLIGFENPETQRVSPDGDPDGVALLETDDGTYRVFMWRASEIYPI